MNTADLLKFDPLQAAEDLIGHGREADLLGFAMAMQHSELKRQHLESLGDSTFSNDLIRYQQIIEDLGFKQVLDIPFQSPYEEKCNEHYFIYVQRELGILLSFDTYRGDQVNGGKFHYCIKFDNNDARVGVTSSGCFRDYDTPNQYWAGDHDCREAIRYNIANLSMHGNFLKNWPKNNDIFLWLLHHADTKIENYDYKKITAERIAMLPVDVQEQFGFR